MVFYDRRGTRVVRLEESEAVRVGRAAPADVIIEDPSLSRCHARFERRTDGVWVTDLQSTNGVRVGGEKVQEVRLVPGSAVVLGAVTASLHVTAARGRSLEGLGTHEVFMQRTEEEVERARRFGRSFAMVFVRVLEAEGHVDSFVPRLRAELRDVDRLSVYSRQALLLLLPELASADAERMAHKLIAPRMGEPTLRAGIASFPDDGAGAHALLVSARRASRKATGDRPVYRVTRGSDAEEPLILADASRALYDTIARLAPSHLNVLLVGETGSGKEFAAQAVHRQSGPRSQGPLRSVNCGALTDTLLQSALFGHVRGAFTGADSDRAGLFEAASGGTLFLDEVGELSGAAQAALLRVLETGRVARVGATTEVAVDVRVVAATHRDLHEMVKAGTFRQDLLYRLDGVSLAIAPLRGRRAEILPLAERFLNQVRAGLSLSKDAAACLEAYGWPGNVRELRNAVERAGVICDGDHIEVDDLPPAVRAPQPAESPHHADVPLVVGERPFKEQVKQYEIALILRALEECGGNQTQAAKALGMPLRTLVHKIRQYGIKKRFDQA